MNLYSWVFPVLRADVIDGDTVAVMMDMGWIVTMYKHCRIIGVDTPERNTEAGKAVTRVVKEWIANSSEYTLKVRSIERDPFEPRFVGDLVHCDKLDRVTGMWLSEFLIKHNLCKPFRKGQERKWTSKELSTVLSSARQVVA